MEHLSDIHPAVLIAWLTVGTLAIVYFLVRKFIDFYTYEKPVTKNITYTWNKEAVVDYALNRLTKDWHWTTPEDLAVYERLHLATLAILQDPKVEEGHIELMNAGAESVAKALKECVDTLANHRWNLPPGVELVSASTGETQTERGLQVSLKALEEANTGYKLREVRLHGTIGKLYSQLGLDTFSSVGVGNANAALDEVMTAVAKLQAKVVQYPIQAGCSVEIIKGRRKGQLGFVTNVDDCAAYVKISDDNTMGEFDLSWLKLT